jgi:uncharacterized protein involved in exopolysaccharide biosynthesis
MLEVEDARTSPRLREPSAGDVLPRVRVFDALRRHWFQVACVTILLAGVGVAIGLLRKPAYTAEASMQIGRIDVNAPGSIAGFTQATQNLATSYSRAVDADPIVRVVSKRVGASPSAVRKSLSASPIPESSVFRIRAQASSSGRAIRTANYAAEELPRYVATLQGTNPVSAPLYARFKDLASTATLLRTTVNGAQRDYQRNRSQHNQAALARANANLEGVQLQLDVLRANYQSSEAGFASASLVQQLTMAASATSDRLTKTETYVFTGLVAGLIIGGLLAIMRANSETRRRLDA